MGEKREKRWYDDLDFDLGFDFGDSLESLVFFLTLGLAIYLVYLLVRCAYRAITGTVQRPAIKASIEKKSQALRDMRDAVGAKASAMAPRSSRQVTITARR